MSEAAKIAATASKPLPQVHCPVCELAFDRDSATLLDALEEHLAGEHLNFLPYRCGECRCADATARFVSERAIDAHYASEHAGLSDYQVRVR